MQPIAQKISKIIYKGIMKPVIFKFVSPDKAHEKMVKLGVKTQKSKTLKKLIKSSWSYQNKESLSQKIHGINFSNPIGLSAGLDKNFEIPEIIEAVGFGFMEGGSITYDSYKGNRRPWFVRLPLSKALVVNVGLANWGTKKVINNLKKYNVGMPINISVAKTNSPSTRTEEDGIKDYIESLKIIKKENAGQIITLNISCPNVFGGEPFATPAKLEGLLTEVDKLKLKQPVFVKMPIDKTIEEFSKLLDVTVKHDVAGVTIANLFKDRSKIRLKDPLPNSVLGNLSGKPTFNRSNLLIKRAYQTHGDKLTIIGVGGVFDAKDAYAKIRCGASLVEMITGLIFEGPQIVGEINRDLVKLLRRDGFKNISEAIGIDAKR